jgi:hypothetical protein
VIVPDIHSLSVHSPEVGDVSIGCAQERSVRDTLESCDGEEA